MKPPPKSEGPPSPDKPSPLFLSAEGEPGGAADARALFLRRRAQARNKDRKNQEGKEAKNQEEREVKNQEEKEVKSLLKEGKGSHPKQERKSHRKRSQGNLHW